LEISVNPVLRSEGDVNEQPTPIFIGGTGRCGTTILNYMLRGHNDVRAHRYESMFLTDRDGLLDLLDRPRSAWALARFGKRLTGDWFKKATTVRL